MNFPSMRYHPTLPAIKVNDPEEDELLDKQWRDYPYPMPVVEPAPAEPTLPEVKAMNAELVDQIAKLTAERDAALQQGETLAAELPKLSKEVDKLRAALAKKPKAAEAPPVAPQPAEAGPKADEPKG